MNSKVAGTIVLVWWSLLWASGDSLFLEANRLYDAERYDSAATLYSEVITQDAPSSVVYYNLGNCSYRMGRVGEAILYLKRAQRLAPRDEEIEANLSYLRTQIVDEIPQGDRNPITDALTAVHELFSLSYQLWFLFAGSVVAAVLLAVILFRSGAIRVWGIYLLGAVLFVMTLLALSAGVKVYHLERVREAVVLVESVEARSEPGSGTVLFTIHEGTTVRLLDSQGKWRFVALPNGVSGYVRDTALGEI